MTIQKKSLISNLSATKKAVVVTKTSTPAQFSEASSLSKGNLSKGNLSKGNLSKGNLSKGSLY
ncbi:MAG TPA: hypothetical protein VE779_01695 [Candidatus Angelobacter sp.]|nr:hypothetical protein [Candidatus Angelobacter sp.]